MKAKILQIGYVDRGEDGLVNIPKCWAFDCMNKVNGIETKDGNVLYGGYTVQELKDIGIKAIARSNEML